MQRNIRILLSSSTMLHAAVNLLAPIYAIYITEIGGTLLEAGATIGIYAILRGILFIGVGRIKERAISRKAMIGGGYVVFAIGYSLYIFAKEPLHIFAIQALLAIGEVIVTPSWSAVIATSLEQGKERRIYADFYGYRSLFEGLAAFAGGYVVMQFSFTFLFELMTGFALLAAIVSLFIVEPENTEVQNGNAPIHQSEKDPID